jgi:osmotically-inducible protein OsmY
MQTHLTLQRRLALLPLVLIPLLSACGKSEESAGQKLDEMSAKTEQLGRELKDDAQQAAAQAAQVVNDTAITARIKAALAADGELKALRIDVDTREGEVTLRGSAPTLAAQARAADLAKAIVGVRRVDNLLVVERKG